mmetsp:Transcript_32245/g.83733  ORF Transcript_32245/g.83733 Transcript_32245/m.83733 type:complete len:93 (+) Transcript_32245:202-480(+)
MGDTSMSISISCFPLSRVSHAARRTTGICVRVCLFLSLPSFAGSDVQRRYTARLVYLQSPQRSEVGRSEKRGSGGVEQTCPLSLSLSSLCEW